ncbi:small vasohibin-binding protein isoform X1 [Agelaius tricolor]|uniref:small vasohibin-binding protein isoform X1 n=1 Tax=Agelaius tricolor TaxID=9191 RepID=UPI0039F21160
MILGITPGPRGGCGAVPCEDANGAPHVSLGCLGVSRARGSCGWLRDPRLIPARVAAMDPGAGARKERPKPREPAARLEKAKQRSAQQELKQRQRAEIYALNRVMTELEQQQFDSFCKQMQGSGE